MASREDSEEEADVKTMEGDGHDRNPGERQSNQDHLDQDQEGTVSHQQDVEEVSCDNN